MEGLLLFLAIILCCQVEVSAMDRSLVQRSLTECGVSEYDREASIMGRPWPIEGGGGCLRHKNSSNYFNEETRI